MGDLEIPTIPDIHKEVYKAVEGGKYLDMGDWHNICGTTHCRAGWVTTLAGDAGKKLEDKMGPSLAAALIYQKSDPQLKRIPDFTCSNAETMKDIKRLGK